MMLKSVCPYVSLLQESNCQFADLQESGSVPLNRTIPLQFYCINHNLTEAGLQIAVCFSDTLPG